MSVAFALHLLAAAVWVGGMFFAYLVLRPAAAEMLEPPMRLRLWTQVLWRFFPFIKASIILLFLSGFWMVHGLGGMSKAGWQIHLMEGTAVVMTVVFFLIRGKYYRGLRVAVEREDWAEGAVCLGTIRKAVGFNLVLGLAILTMAGLGRYLA